MVEWCWSFSEANNIGNSYSAPVNKRSTTALKVVSLSIRKGEIIGIIGPAGSSKSTFLQV
ncbi:ATP-binding cassette domain-containing protein [Rossellomorea aquimaris]|uniref:ATP-binding cassette domain-containing protein n=1 Tax=Rossellomorea aquimaris TaxID=189382 RepID=A0A5D4U5S2_9BACI|nr:ATP-binding cassette domain-containing protein [Rossellomorea aquimaris]